MSLIAHYNLNGDAKDFFGNDGTPSNVTWVNGKIDKAGDFNGTSSNIPIPENSGTAPVGSFSVAGWIYPRVTNSNDYVYLSGRDNNSGLRVYIASGNLYFNVYIDGTRRAIGTSISASQWTHFVATYDSSKGMKLFVNGNLLSSNANTGTVTYVEQYGNAPSIGSHGGIYEFDGLIDDFRIYDHALSEREVKDLAKAKTSHLYFNNAPEPTAISPTFTTESKIGRGSYVFNGMDTYVATDPIVGTGDFTASITWACWVQPNAATGDIINMRGAEGSSNSNWNMCPIWSSGQRFYAKVWDMTTLSANSNFVIGQYYHLVLVRDYSTSTNSFYINGELVGTSTGTYSSSGVDNQMYYGRAGSQATNTFFDGKIDDAQIYMEALTADEVENLYKTGLAVDDHHRMHSAFIKEGFPYISEVNSATAGWPVGSAESGFNDTTGESDPCSGLLTFENAVLYAQSQGGRLPTKEELENNATATTGCGYDAQLCWSCTKGKNDSEHWVVVGRSTYSTPPEVRKNTQTAYVRFVADDNLDRPDPVYISDSVIQNTLGINTVKIERGVTKHNEFSEVGVSKGLVSWFPLKGDAKDRVSNQVATVNGAVPTADGYDFDGVDDYLFVPDPLLFPSTITIEFLLYWGNLNTSNVEFICEGDVSSNLMIHLGGGAGTNGLRFVLTPTSTIVDTPNIIQGGWNHYAVTTDGTTVWVYRNGVEINAVAAQQFAGSTSNLNIGRRNNVYFLNGKLANFRIYNTTLTPEEVAQEYQSSLKSMINKSTAFAKEFIEV